MNKDVKTFLEFKANTLKRVLSRELTAEQSNTLIQPALTEAIATSSLSKDSFLKEVATTQYSFIINKIENEK